MMEQTPKIDLVDPRMLDTFRAQSPTDIIGKKVQALDDEIMLIHDRKDLDKRCKVTLYNQVLQLYNALTDKRAKEPVRVVALN